MSRRTIVFWAVAGAISLVGFTRVAPGQALPATQPTIAPPARGMVAAPSMAGTQPATTHPVIDPDKLKEIRKLLDVTGARAAGETVAAMMMGRLSQIMPSVPADVWAEAKKAIDSENLVNMLASVYDRHMSVEEVREVLRFYESPTGRKLLAVQPMIAQESMIASREWISKEYERTIQYLRDKGYQLPAVPNQGLRPPAPMMPGGPRPPAGAPVAPEPLPH